MRKTLKMPFQLKSIDETGKFSGYASVFGNKDSYSDVVLKGAFTKSLDAHREAGTMPAFLYQHRHDSPIGIFEKMSEDDHGLYVEGQFNLEVQQAREARSLTVQKALNGLSIGYDIPKGGGNWNDENETFELSQINLWETSLVTFPANDKATVMTVKSANGHLTKRDIEKALRDVCGLSVKEAKRFMSDGFKSIATDERDVVDEADKEALQKLLSNFKGVNNDNRSTRINPGD